jgi:hypothetical protein
VSAWQRGVLVGVSLCAAATAAQAAVDTPLVVTADLVHIEDGVATGIGAVRVEVADIVITGLSFRFDSATQRLWIIDGSWQRSDGNMAFGELELDVEGRSAVVQQANYRGADGRIQLQAERLRIDGGPWLAEDLSLTTCTCETAPWEIRAARVRVEPGDKARFTRGWLDVCGLPVLPIPFGRVPLQPRASGLLPPHLGLGDDGLRLGQPVYLVLGPSADLTVEPELRTERGARGLLEARWALATSEGGELQAAAGWDTVDLAPRGAIGLRHGWAPGPWWTAADALVVSDLRYLDDYGGDFLSRQASWTEARLGAGLGPLRLWSDTFQADVPVAQQPVAAVIDVSGRGPGQVALRATAQADLVGEGSDVIDGGDLTTRLTVRTRAETGKSLGPTRADLAIDARARAWQSGERLADGAISAVWQVQSWSALESGTLLHEVGLAAQVAANEGALPADPLPDEQVPQAWSVGPVGTTRLVRGNGVPLTATGSASMRPDGPWGQGILRVNGRASGVRLSLDPDVQLARAWLDDGRLSLAATTARLDMNGSALLQASTDVAWTLPPPLGEWRPSYKLLFDVTEGSVLSHGPGLQFTSRCDCLKLGLKAAWSQDRVWPDLGAQVEVY